MNVSFRPELQAFIDEQVKTGRYQSAQAVLEDALMRMMEEEIPPLDDAAIERADGEIDRGEALDWKEVSAELRRKHLNK